VKGGRGRGRKEKRVCGGKEEEDEQWYAANGGKVTERQTKREDMFAFCPASAWSFWRKKGVLLLQLDSFDCFERVGEQDVFIYASTLTARGTGGNRGVSISLNAAGGIFDKQKTPQQQSREQRGLLKGQ
jgi:hypothetical protein